MKLLLSSVLLTSVCVLSAWSVSSGTLVVTQSPDVSVVEGDAVNITCCWTGAFQQVKVNWLKNQTEIKNESFSLKSQSLKNESNNCSSLTFSNITQEDSGRYICKVFVEMPVYDSTEGRGTVVTVTARENKTGVNTESNTSRSSYSMNVLIHVLRCLPFLLLLLTFFYFINRQTRTHKPAAAGEDDQERRKEMREE